uniref:monoamine oxidase n=1 Tax=Chromera velia CCMP2878 TaxID=1169474 RepID=A0A0G4ICL0_9ALVE|eukprot:Cvel_2285.t1-p1 / transcript=Cvel_2285.t1 / gene=Cvel_2285 / organism=Chromera_velia_CCMP2878 / gene_product=Putative flavin-containing monoamine oxidase AofH, putative / transcript_product=Putative flavin-containing monoamine oxidase AofH, putative / location=Cvel_scaffold88:104411-105553(+) / protein_length=381 / sequence_SO=supercontig / SO=protein_coding / is_pseudo=false
MIDVTVIGAGLSGLTAALLLVQSSSVRQIHLVESRPRLGGRVLTLQHNPAADTVSSHSGIRWSAPDAQPSIAEKVSTASSRWALLDAGGTWIWQSSNPRLHRLSEDLRVSLFADPKRGGGDQMRFSGGTGALVDAISEKLAASDSLQLTLSDAVTSMHRDTDGVKVTLTSGKVLLSKRVIVAVPPRIAAEIDFSPPLAEDMKDAMRATKTWMAQQGKWFAIYETPFWETEGHSATAFCRPKSGPIDSFFGHAQPEGPGVIFGFLSHDPRWRRLTVAERDKLARHQIAQTFDSTFREKIIASYAFDWASEKDTATDLDRAERNPWEHPVYDPRTCLHEVHWDGCLLFASSEADPGACGFLEGAVAAAERAVRNVLKMMRTQQ